MNFASLSVWIGALLCWSTFGFGDALEEFTQSFARLSVQFQVDRPNDSRFDPFGALVALYQNRKLIPDNSVVHIVGPGSNIYEWLILRMVRKDVTIVIFEKERVFPNIEMEQIGEAWRYLRKVYPRFAQDVTFSLVEIQREVLVPDRESNLIFVHDIHAEMTAFGQLIPKANFIVSMMPEGEGRHFAKHANTGALGWVVTTVNEFLKIQGIYGSRLRWQYTPPNYLTQFFFSSNIDLVHCREVFGRIENAVRIRPFLFQVK